MEEKEIKTSTTFDNLKKVFRKEKPDFTAEYAWLETTYGCGTYRSLEQRINDKREYIKNLIRSKFPSHDERYRPASVNVSYRCVVDIEEDLMCCVDEVFKPFVEGGFKIINLSEVVKEIDDENVYLISWKKVFNKRFNNKQMENGTNQE